MSGSKGVVIFTIATHCVERVSISGPRSLLAMETPRSLFLGAPILVRLYTAMRKCIFTRAHNRQLIVLAINRNRSAAKISKVMSSNIYPAMEQAETYP